MIHFVYKTTNLINNKKYIGKHSTTNIDDGYLGSGKLLLKAIEKYGKKNFQRKILIIVDSEEEAYWYEQQLVTMKIVEDGLHYNLRIGGEGSVKGKENFLYGRIGKNAPMWGKKHTEETKKKISDAVKGKNHPLYGKTGEKCIWFGKHHTEETKRKMSEAQKGKKFTEEHKKKISKFRKGFVYVKKQCPYCKRNIGINNYDQWHGDNCKDKI